MSTMPSRRLTRPRDDRWIAGVCAGLGRRFGISPGVVRLLFVLSCLHLDALDIRLTTLTKVQAEHLGVDVAGPYKPDHYRY